MSRTPTRRSPGPARAEARAAVQQVQIHHETSAQRRGVGLLARYAVVAVLATLVACWSQRIDRADFHTLFQYETGDVMMSAAVVKNLVERGSVYSNPALGAPFGSEHYDFPLTETFQYGVMKALGWLNSDYAFVVNAYYLVSAALAAVVSYGVMGAFGVSFAPALAASLLYSALPYRYYHGEHHLLLSAYYVLPLVVMVLLWLLQTPKLGQAAPAPPLRRSFEDRRLWVSAGVIALVALTGMYYAFFAGFFLAVAAASASLKARSIKAAAIPALLIAVLAAVVTVNLAPSLLYWHSNGRSNTASRDLGETNRYALKITPLLLPIPQHRVARLAQLRQIYSAAVDFDPSATTVGAVGAAGILALLLAPLTGGLREDVRLLLRNLSLLALSGILVATNGGFGQMFALLVSPQFRAYNRILPYLAFFALLTVAVGLHFLPRPTRLGRWRSVPALLIVGLVGAGGILDQTSSAWVPDYASSAAAARSDREFVQAIERITPPDAMLFQLPYMDYPEHIPINRMGDYDPLRGYLNGRWLRWSYGALKGRFADAWIKSTAARPISGMLPRLSLAGFAGVVVDRFGYADHGAALERALTDALGQCALESADARMVFYRLDGFTQALRRQWPDWEERKRALLDPVYLEWQPAFAPLESEPAGTNRWCGREGWLAIVNPYGKPLRAVLEMRVFPGVPAPAGLWVRGGGLDAQYTLTAAGANIQLICSVPPGKTFLRFSAGAPLAFAVTDTRGRYFRLENFRAQLEGLETEILQNN